ncbi:HpcH/HpaI aldolase/citrate lyase family protein [Agrobacterium sp. T29]|uniref:HpcH/HpaI aldolase family protein n=1 Tax=Agrobacterium sp. T29 TaxID=2580515 RepID=UPI001FEEB386|nr:aldolase/citrate lyase family protein [Agrobacterium sp. T29]
MKNPIKSLLQAGGACVNGWLSIPSGYGAEVMARAGWDALTVDLQHGVQDYQSLVNCFQAIAAFPVTPLARVPSNEPGIIGKVLDVGAWGVICPMVNSPQEAEAFVSACLYPPYGTRSNGPNRAGSYGGSDQSYQSFANEEVLVIPMIETVAAVSQLEAILDVRGISGVYVGPSDLGFSHGLPPVFDSRDSLMLDIYRHIVAETSRRGLFAGIHTIDPAYAVEMQELGFRFVTIASDASLMAKAARETVQTFRFGTNGSIHTK